MKFFRTLGRLLAAMGLLTVIVVAVLNMSVSRLSPSDGVAGPREWVGAIHVHTDRSHDGGGSLDQAVAAAAAQGLNFIVVTDHNQRALPQSEYRGSVLVVVGEEVNTPFGHLLVLGDSPIGDRRTPETWPSAPEQPGAERPVPPVSVSASEGFRIAAHPTGRTGWTAPDLAHVDGSELWNADTEWRDDSVLELLRAISLLPLRRRAGLLTLLDYPEEALEYSELLGQRGPAAGMCSVDAHNSLPLNRSGSLDLHFPRFEDSFSLARQHVLLPNDPLGDAAADAESVLRALRTDNSLCAFGVRDARGATVEVTSALSTDPGAATSAPRHLVVTIPTATSDVRLRLFHRGELIDSAQGGEWQRDLSSLGPGQLRVEAWIDWEGPKPWILATRWIGPVP